MTSQSIAKAPRPILLAASQSPWRLLLTLWLEGGRFRNFAAFAVIGAIVLAFLHGLVGVPSIWDIFAQPGSQISGGQPPGPSGNPLPITPHIDELLFDEAYFASVQEPLRTHLVAATRDYEAHDYQRMIADVATDDENDPRVLLVRGTAMVISSDHDTFMQGLELLTNAGKLGEAKAIGILGVLRLVGFVGYPQDILRGRGLLQRSAELGDIAAARVVGMGFVTGWMGSIDPDQGVRYLRSASDRGDTEATFQLAKILSVGLGVAKNQSEAEQLMLKAAQADHLDAQMMLGYWQLRAYSAGLTASPDSAVAWLQKASDRGKDDAKYTLGLFYMLSKPTSAYYDQRRGAELLRQCAERSLSAHCTFAYATALQQGSGVALDRIRAYAFYQISETAESTSKSLQRLKELKAMMSPADIAAGDALVVKLRENAALAQRGARAADDRKG
jgi:TPR repeat protein